MEGLPPQTDFEDVLKSKWLKDRQDAAKTHSVMFSITGSISFIASSTVIYHILRSHKGLSTTYHRLVFGLCISDIMFSLANAFSLFATPEEMKYIMPMASGNVVTCSLQGLLLTTGLTCVSLYNCSLCFYYLAIVKLNKKDDEIQKKLELWFHGVPIILSIAIGILGLALKSFNTNGTGSLCYAIAYNPPHCIGYNNGDVPAGFTIPCGRGDPKNEAVGNFALLALSGIPLGITPVVIIVTMFLMLRVVKEIEANSAMRTYGASNDADTKPVPTPGTLPVLLEPVPSTAVVRSTNETRILRSTEDSFLVSPISQAPDSENMMSTSPRPSNQRRSSDASRSPKRALLFMAMSYSLTWILIFIPAIVSVAFPVNDIAGFLSTVFTPLQGLYNLIVYMLPKVRSVKNGIGRNGREQWTWLQAIRKAWMSKGEARKKKRTKGTGDADAKKKKPMSKPALSPIDDEQRSDNSC